MIFLRQAIFLSSTAQRGGCQESSWMEKENRVADPSPEGSTAWRRERQSS